MKNIIVTTLVIMLGIQAPLSASAEGTNNNIEDTRLEFIQSFDALLAEGTLSQEQAELVQDYIDDIKTGTPEQIAELQNLVNQETQTAGFIVSGVGLALVILALGVVFAL